MSVLFTIFGVIAYLLGFLVFSTASSSIHEAVALIAILNGSVFFVGAGVISAINKTVRKTKEDKIALVLES